MLTPFDIKIMRVLPDAWRARYYVIRVGVVFEFWFTLAAMKIHFCKMIRGEP